MEKKRVLIVDDDKDDQDEFIHVVNTIDPLIECRCALDGVEAFHCLEKNKDVLPDYIFLDLNMPKMDGKQFLKAVKSNDVFKHIPVIIYTTSSQIKDIQQTADLGAAYYITKPTTMGELRKKIEFVLLGKISLQ